MYLKKRIFHLACLLLVLIATPSHALYTYQKVLEEYAKGLDYLDDKIFIYKVDLSGNGYQDLLLTTSNNTYADLNRFGLRAFQVYPRLATSNDVYLNAVSIPLYVSDELGSFTDFESQRVIKSYGTPHKDSETPEYYYWMDSEYKIHTNNTRGPEAKIYIDIDKKIADSFVGTIRLSQLLKKTVTVDDVLSETQKRMKQSYSDSIRSKLSRSSSKKMVNSKLLNSTRYEYEIEGQSIYLGDFVGSKNVFYPNGTSNLEAFFNALVQTKGILKKDGNGRLTWEYYFALAPEWALEHPEAAEKLKFLSEGCLPREVCEPIDPLDEAPSTNGNKQPLANDAGNANNSPAVTKEDSNEAPVIEGNEQESQWQQTTIWICVFIGFVFVAGMYIRSRRIKKIK
jgi:hypothetical protein